MAPACFRCPYNKNGVSSRARVGEKIKLVPKPGDARTETGCRWECLGSVEKILKSRKGKIAAGIIEPVMQAAGGMNAMPPGYLAGFDRLLKRYGVLTISDEVATGFGRTGTLFATEQEKASPDFICIAKGLTGGYSPLAATLTTDKIYGAFRAPYEKFRTFFHGHSYTGHPLGCAVARANLKLIKTSKALEKSRHLAHLLRMEIHPLSRLAHVGDIRSAGLMGGGGIVSDHKTKKTLRKSQVFY